MPVVLVHGAFVDGSGWENLYYILRGDGYAAAIVQNPTISLAGDVAATKRVIDAQSGRVLLVGHGYGGMVITEAGNDPKVAGLVYVTAFAPDRDESAASIIRSQPPDAPAPPCQPPKGGFVLLNELSFAAAFAADVDPAKAAFMAASQIPWGLQALHGKVGEPAWKSKPSWYLVAVDDRLISRTAQRAMSKRAGSVVVEAPGSHAIPISQPLVVAALIDKAIAELNRNSD